MKTLKEDQVDFMNRVIAQFEKFRDSGFTDYSDGRHAVSTKYNPYGSIKRLSDLSVSLAHDGVLGMIAASDTPVIAKAQEAYLDIVDSFTKIGSRAAERWMEVSEPREFSALRAIDRVLPGVIRHGKNPEFAQKLFARFKTNLAAVKPEEAKTFLKSLAADVDRHEKTALGSEIHALALASAKGYTAGDISGSVYLATHASYAHSDNPILRRAAFAQAKEILGAAKKHHATLSEAFKELDGAAQYWDNRPFRKIPGRSWGQYFRAIGKCITGWNHSVDPDFVKNVYALRTEASNTLRGVRPDPTSKVTPGKVLTA